MNIDTTVSPQLQVLCTYFATPPALRPHLTPPSGGLWHLDTGLGDVRTDDVAQALAALYLSAINRYGIQLLVEHGADDQPESELEVLLGELGVACEEADDTARDARLQPLSQALQAHVGAVPAETLGERLRDVLIEAWHP